MRVNRRYLAADAAALVVYLVAANPALTGVAAHEWLSLGLLVVFFIHVALHVGGLRAARSKAPRANLALDALILVALAVVAVSGIMVSGAVLPALGLHATGYFFWDPLHAASAKALLALLLVHAALHAGWVAAYARQARGGS